MRTQDALGLIIRQYADRPRGRATIALLLGQSDVTGDTFADLPGALDIQTAEGVNLDLVGKHVGLDRRLTVSSSDGLVLGDDDYRLLLRARAYKNFMVGTIPDLMVAVQRLFGDEAFVIDHLDMAITALIPSETLTDFVRYALTELDILPRPAGVWLRRLEVPTCYFGFLEDPSTRRAGFDVGVFATYF